ncbi:hypothetical protein V5799_004090 [Amblyomma americanum]|uniref:Triglyceride lipase-cholesterol esterase n=1 Tax=Amblyomma americanum TaxID=6943 RepID=A0AAQ4D738_AMBAM
MAKYDLPAQIDFILRETNRRALEYVGWSQGTLIMFALLAEQPRYNRKVRLFNAMAPVAYLGHMTSDIKLLIPVSKMLAKRPPQYDLSKVTAPVALYWSDGDVLVTPRDVAHLERSLPNVVLSYKVPVHGFTHIDFAWSTRAWKHVYRKILEMMTTYSRT